MTIKEIEKLLEIPRATVRFYEKEGLISPDRKGNGYRHYSDEDIEKLRKVIILRKIGLSVNDINDIFDGAKSMQEVLDLNVNNLKKQMEELKGAISISRKMKEDIIEISSMDTDRYWNEINEEEKQGNSFIDIAKDIVDIEKGVIYRYFSCSDEKEDIYHSVPRFICDVIVAIVLTGILLCLYRGKWTIHNFMGGLVGIASIMLVEVVLSIPLYFMGKKYLWIKNNRKKVLILTCIVLCIVLLILSVVLGI